MDFFVVGLVEVDPLHVADLGRQQFGKFQDPGSILVDEADFFAGYEFLYKTLSDVGFIENWNDVFDKHLKAVEHSCVDGKGASD